MVKGLVTVSAVLLACSAVGCSSDKDKGNDGSNNGNDEEIELIFNDHEGPTGDGGTVDLTDEQVDDTLNAACAGFALEPENIPGVLQLVIDVSLSMEYTAPEGGTKWAVTHAALQQAIDALPASLAVGIQTYPNSEATHAGPNPGCVTDEGLVLPDLLGEAGSDQRRRIEDHLNAVQLTLGTPTHDAYLYALDNGMSQYTGSGDKFMLLITDGAPTQLLGCGTLTPTHEDPVDTRPILASIADAYSQGIRTFIIGSPGSEGGHAGEPGLDMREWLSQAAVEGGTATLDCTIQGPNFCHFDMSQTTDFSMALAQGLGAISAQVANSCVFSLPSAPAGKTIDPTLTSVVVQRGDGSNALILADTQGDCTEGWKWDDDGHLVLCDTSCDEVKSDAAASVTVVVGCTEDEIIDLR